MYTPLISSLTLLGGIIGSTTAYPTQSTFSTQADDSLTSLTSLYTPHPSHPGSLTLLSPQNLGISFPYLLTSTCPALTTDWSTISHDLLIHLLRLYPSGPTSSPYYTIQHSSPPSSDIITLSETLSLPTTHPDVSYRSTLSLSIFSGGPDAVSVERISAEDWRSLLGLLLSANSAVMAGTQGEGFGKLEMGGVMPLGGRGAAAGRRRRLAPSDVVFPYFADVDTKREEEEEEVQEGKKGLKWSAEWVYYGVVRGDDGVEKVLECAAMPDVELWVGDKERKTEAEKEEVEEEDSKIDL